MQLYTNTTNEANAAFRLIYAVKYGSYRGCQRVSAVKSVFLNDFRQARAKLYLTYYERAVVSDKEWNAYVLLFKSFQIITHKTEQNNSKMFFNTVLLFLFF